MQDYWRIALDIPHRDAWTYASMANAPEPQLGQWVFVPFGSRILGGVVLGRANAEDYATIPLEKIKKIHAMSDVYLSEHQLKTAQFIAHYYHEGLGEVLCLGLPKILKQYALYQKYQATLARAESKKNQKNIKKNKEAQDAAAPKNTTIVSTTPQQLNTEQHTALSGIQAQPHFAVHVLHGITGSGKTRVYVEFLRQILQENAQAQVLILVPEIHLSPALQAYLAHSLGVNVVYLHSALTDLRRHQSYMALHQGVARVVVGTRLAVLSSIPHLAAIVVDEEHDASYKQQEGIRYHARDVAIWRAKALNIPIILASASPSLETWHHTQTKRYYYHALIQKAAHQTPHQHRIICIATAQAPPNRAGLSAPMLEQLQCTVEQGKQALLFINRRGYAPVLWCKACHSMLDCPNCSAHLVWHQSLAQACCHHCGHKTMQTQTCPKCHTADIRPIGQGSERLEDFLQEHHPNYRLLRMDSDTIKSPQAMQNYMTAINQDDFAYDILIGTQMIAKGHDFKHLAMVGVIHPDNALYAPHMRAQEQLFQQLLQVAGRAGRFGDASIYIQTQYPKHMVYQHLRTQNYAGFANEMLAQRQLFKAPPYAYSAELHIAAKTLAKAQQAMHDILAKVPASALGIQSSGCLPNPMLKKQDLHRVYCQFEHAKRSILHQYIAQMMPHCYALQGLPWYMDIDP